MGNKESGETADNLADKLIDLELAKSNNNTKLKKYLPIFFILALSYYSVAMALGLALGYFGSKIFTKYFMENGRINPVYINLGKWKFHLHHWITGVLFLVIAGLVDSFYLPKFFVGAVLGIVLHDVYDFDDWNKILVKNEIK